ncbi:MAG: FMN-dependent NADH-azoreductase [Bryobacteraceae bacterium]
MKVLHIDSSARRNRSHTRRLSALCIEELLRRCPGMEVIRRDLAASPPPPVSEQWIAGAFSKPAERTPAMREALRFSDELVDELLASDLYVFGVPMYNYSVPSVFKSYIDQIVRVGRTFAFDPSNHAHLYTGLVQGKSLVVITARGEAGYGPDGPYWFRNHVERYLLDLFRFLGVDRIETIAVENDELGGAPLRESIRSAEARIIELAEELSISFPNRLCPLR